MTICFRMKRILGKSEEYLGLFLLLKNRKGRNMIAFCKKWGHYGIICPIVFLSKELRERLWKCLVLCGKALAENPCWVIVFAIVLLASLLYWRSVELYTYSMDEELQYLGRIPIVWERQKKIYIPKDMVGKSATGRFVIKENRGRNLGKKKRILIVYIGKTRRMLEWDRLMHFQA